MTCRVEELCAGLVQWPEAADCLGLRLVQRIAMGRQLLGAKGQVQLDLVLHLALPVVAAMERQAEQTPDPGADHRASTCGRAVLAAVSMLVTVPAYCIQFFVSARKWARPTGVSL